MKIFTFILLMSTIAFAQNRPSEGSMFGGGPAPVAAPVKSAPVPNKKSVGHEDANELNSSNPERDAFASGEVKDNPLQIGGVLYQRVIVSAQRNVSTDNTPMTMPLQFDGFLDSRPSDRIRGFIDERLLYDSTRDQYGNTTNGTSGSNLQFSSGSTGPTGTYTQSTPTPNNPQVVLDQAWLKFDIDHTVFVTAGKQHVKWGSARYWNPTDFLNTQKLDPLLPYDLRLGTSMIKFEMPLEASKTNLYAVTIFDNPKPASTLGQLGEALRFEKVIGGAEVGIDAIFRGGVAPVYGADISAPLGPFDVYADLAYLTAAPNSIYQVTNGSLTSGSDITTQYTTSDLQGGQIQVSGGANYQFAWSDNRQSVLGIEYFYNQNGYTNSAAYPILMFLGQYQPFYTGRQYAAIYLTAEGPDAQKHTSYTFSTIANLSDSSFISRIDFSWRFLTYLTFESYIDGHYGARGGEFNFELHTPQLTYQSNTIAALNIPSSVVDIGLALRLGF